MADVIVPPEPLPVEKFGNAALRESVMKALEKADEKGHGNALIDVDNKGAGIMAMHRFDSGWKLVGGMRYSWADRGVAASLAVSW